MKCIKFIILIAVISLSATGLFADKMMIAVMDFQGQGVPVTTASIASELNRTEMINAGEFRILERAQMDTILKEQGFQMSGCNDVSCAVEAGKILSAEKILLGTISRLGKKFILNGRIVDVQKGIAEFGQSQSAESVERLDNAAYLMVQNLTRRIKGEYVNVTVDLKSQNVVYVEHHSVFLSATASLLPVISGSWNVGFNLWGLLFVSGNIFCGYNWYRIYTEGGVSKLNPDTSSTTKHLMWAGLYGVTAICDMIYTVYKTREYNKQHEKPVAGVSDVSAFTMAVGPRYPSPEAVEKIFHPEGMNLSVTIQF